MSTYGSHVDIDKANKLDPTHRCKTDFFTSLNFNDFTDEEEKQLSFLGYSLQKDCRENWFMNSVGDLPFKGPASLDQEISNRIKSIYDDRDLPQYLTCTQKLEAMPDHLKRYDGELFRPWRSKEQALKIAENVLQRNKKELVFNKFIRILQSNTAQAENFKDCIDPDFEKKIASTKQDATPVPRIKLKNQFKTECLKAVGELTNSFLESGNTKSVSELLNSYIQSHKREDHIDYLEVKEAPTKSLIAANQMFSEFPFSNLPSDAGESQSSKTVSYEEQTQTIKDQVFSNNDYLTVFNYQDTIQDFSDQLLKGNEEYIYENKKISPRKCLDYLIDKKIDAMAEDHKAVTVHNRAAKVLNSDENLRKHFKAACKAQGITTSQAFKAIVNNIALKPAHQILFSTAKVIDSCFNITEGFIKRVHERVNKITNVENESQHL